MLRWCGALLAGALLLMAASANGEASNDVESIRAQSLFFETFDDESWQSRWTHSADAKYTGTFKLHAAKSWTNKGLKVPEKNKHYGLAAVLPAPVDPIISSGPEVPLPLVVQYEIKYEEGINCGGSYIKLLSAPPAGAEPLVPEALVDSTPYSIMFGPDRCGGPGKVHLIFRHRNANNGSITEKHLAAPPVPESTDYTHIYTLRLHPDHKYEILIDGEIKSSGDLLAAGTLAPPLLPPATVPDPDDTKPADWVDLAVMPDPDAVKPADWDDNEKIEDASAVKPKGWQEDETPLIDDPAAKQPADWDEEEDGVWEPNQVANPKCKVGCGPWRRPIKANPAYKGAWKRPTIDNPAYKGAWVQRTIPNPDAYAEDEPLRTGVAPIGGIALELWTIDSGYLFDNLIITRDPAVAQRALEALWTPRHEAEVEAFEAQLKENQEREKLEKKAEKADRKKSPKKGGRKGAAQLEALTDTIVSFFEEGGALSVAEPALRPLLDWLREHPEGSVLLVGVTPLLLLTVLMVLRTRSRSAQESKEAAAKKTDAVQADDEEEEEAEEEPAGEEAAKAGPSKAAAKAKAAEAAEEVVAEAEDEEEEAEEEEEEEEEEPAEGARRRTRRAA